MLKDFLKTATTTTTTITVTTITTTLGYIRTNTDSLQFGPGHQVAPVDSEGFDRTKEMENKEEGYCENKNIRIEQVGRNR